MLFDIFKKSKRKIDFENKICKSGIVSVSPEEIKKAQQAAEKKLSEENRKKWDDEEYLPFAEEARNFASSELCDEKITLKRKNIIRKITETIKIAAMFGTFRTEIGIECLTDFTDDDWKVVHNTLNKRGYWNSYNRDEQNIHISWE